MAMGDYAWAWFAAHQATAAAKAFHMRYGQIAWGHSVLELLAGLPDTVRPGEELLGRDRPL